MCVHVYVRVSVCYSMHDCVCAYVCTCVSVNVCVCVCISAGSIYRSIAILAKVRYRYLVVSRYFDTFGIERPLFDTFDISILDIESIRRCRCEDATSLLMTTLFTGAITTALRSLN